MLFRHAFVLALVLAPFAAHSEPVTLIEWDFNAPITNGDWENPNHINDLRVEDGSLTGEIADWDPFITGPLFEIPTSPMQCVEFRLKTNVGGSGEFYWTETTESPYNGFFPEQVTNYAINGDNEWHTYQVFPYWHTKDKIIRIRLDFARPNPATTNIKTFELDYVRIIDLGKMNTFNGEPSWEFAGTDNNWTSIDGAVMKPEADALSVTPTSTLSGIASPMLDFELIEHSWLSIEMAVDKGQTAILEWVTSERSGLPQTRFSVIPDGRFHTYNIDVSGTNLWSGKLMWLKFLPTNEPGATARIKRISAAIDPLGPPEVISSYLGLSQALCRAGNPFPLVFQYTNQGGETANLSVADLKLPAGVTVTSPDGWQKLPPVDPMEYATWQVMVQSMQPVSGEIQLTLAGPGAPAIPIKGKLEITAPLNLAKADYVPEPQPIKSDYEIGALYFPGWASPTNWEPIQRVDPIRRPVLGWYDESNPECVDWQIKWAVENGISFFMVDWYWSKGGRSLEHWINAYKQAKYRSYLKWCMMWANHNGPGSHSEADQRQATQYWIDNYFNMPEYYCIDGMPVVMIWSPEGMEQDMAGKGGCKRLLEISQEMAKAAGYKGIVFVAMKWPEDGTDPSTIQRLADMGFDMTSIYHYMANGGKAKNPYKFPFDLVVDSSYDHWKSWNEAGILPFLPNLSTGWDSRPWHGDAQVVITDRTVDKFGVICQEARRFADETGIKRMVLAPLNEWGEGSYAEPNMEFGFGMYEQVRQTFGQEPATGWPLNYTPSDVELGPYDYSSSVELPLTDWNFETGGQGWGVMMGVSGWKVQDGELSFTSSGTDPAIMVSMPSSNAKKFSALEVTLRVESNEPIDDKLQVFWATTTSSTNEAASVQAELADTAETQTVILPLAESRLWRGRLRSLRLDFGSKSDVTFHIEHIRLVPVE